MLAQIKTAAVVGMEGRPVLVEVHIGTGLPSINFVGLPDTAVREAKDRVRAALLSSDFEWPNRRVTINLAPADIPKLGSSYDLAIALGILVAGGKLPAAAVESLWVFGELGLDGSVRSAPGLLAVANAALRARALLVCAERDLPQVRGMRGLELAPIRSVRQLIDGLGRARVSSPNGTESRSCSGGLKTVVLNGSDSHDDDGSRSCDLDLADVRGQPLALRAIEIAAAGALNLLMYGPPGSGKTMIARRAPGILPPLDDDSAMEVQLIYSLLGAARAKKNWRTPPFRAPHHTCSTPALVGGGSGMALPGEVSLAHRGVLFLDELSLFSQHTLDALRQPIEDGEVVISRSKATVKYPSATMLIAAANPCPCGRFVAFPRAQRFAENNCRCADAVVEKYKRRISGPLLDRFDLAIPLNRVDPDLMIASPLAPPSADVRKRVEVAREVQAARLGVKVKVSDISSAELARRLPLGRQPAEFLARLAAACGYSGRRIHRIQRAAWVIAALDERDEANVTDIEEAGRLWIHPYGES